MGIIKRRRRQAVFFASLVALLIVFVAVLYLATQPTKTLVTSKTTTIALNQVTANMFNYAGVAASGNMTTGCSVPATLELTVSKVTHTGGLRIYINDFYVGYAQISGVGKVAIVSGCGCSTSCVCEIRVGDNVIMFISQGFSGELKYEVHVKK